MLVRTYFRKPIVLGPLVCASAVILSAASVASDQPYGQFTGWKPRLVAEDELKSSRGAVEDKLRTDVLGVFFDEQRLEQLRKILNGPWDKSAVERLENILLSGVPENGQLRINYFQWEAIANMLAYVAKGRAGDPVAGDIEKIFDRLFGRAMALDPQLGKPYSWVWGSTADAVGKYGTAQLLTNNFWKGIEHERWAYRPLESLGNGTVLRRLKDIRERHPWPKDSRMPMHVDKTISIIEIQLQYPELRQVKDRVYRRSLGRRLQRMKGPELAKVEILLERAEAGEGRQALIGMAKRMKEEVPDP